MPTRFSTCWPTVDPEGRATVGPALDVRDKSAFAAVRDQLVDRWGAVHVLVNNAALTKAESLMDISPDSFGEIVSTNLNIASLAGQNGGTATGAYYAAAKGGVATLTKVFARELAPHGVTVNAISPGPLDLPVVRDIISPDKIDDFERAIPIRRLGRPEFIADMAVLFSADHADAVTGACWDANGGLYMR
ncbi:MULTISPECIES: SDR family NAD(P)-dependent oxidoreductase [Streptomyces]|uniref:SDR family NAD(P)-dependent oxidoreductase n=1 Tax=Streptomyces lycopersici TaxID=2974589 RepID=UPI0021D1EA66|nr:SDR family oxidoreductase [Streptomyces sp. NEAU-383]